MQPSPAATERVRRWARQALQAECGGIAVRQPAAAGAAVGVEDVLAAIARHRLVELLDTHSAALDLAPQVREALAAARASTRRPIMVRRLELARVAELLDRAGIAWLVLKGPALAVQTTGDAAARGAGDIDVLVAPECVPAVFALLSANGWTVRAAVPTVPTSWAWRHVVRTYHEMAFDGPNSTVDVHWRLDPTAAALPDFDTVWARRVSVDIADVAAYTLSIPDAFAHTCHHAAGDTWRWLRSLVDVHRLARHPEAWTATRPARLVIATLAVTDASVGLPPELPTEVLARVRAVPSRTPRRARAAQDRVAHAANPAPGAWLIGGTRYRIAASHSPADLRLALASAALPVGVVAGVDDRSAWIALPRLAGRRVIGVVRRLRSWQRLRRRMAGAAGSCRSGSS